MLLLTKTTNNATTLYHVKVDYELSANVILRTGHRRWKQKKLAVNPGLTSHMCRMRESFVSDCLKIGTSSSFFSWIIQNITVNSLLVGNEFCRPYKTENLSHVFGWFNTVLIRLITSHFALITQQKDRNKVLKHESDRILWHKKSRVGWEGEEMAGNAIFMRMRQICL